VPTPTKNLAKTLTKADKRAARKAAKSSSKRGAGKQLGRKKTKEVKSGRRGRKVPGRFEEPKNSEF
jgi:hypothetical protein